MGNTQAVQSFLRLSRQVMLKAPVPISVARSNLEGALSEAITLSGQFQYTRCYKGHLRHDRLRLRGPIAAMGRQFCFLVDGDLREQGSDTVLNGKIYLTDGNFYQLVGAAATIFIFLAIAASWGTLVITPIFLAFIYGMTQWHFQHYASEITRLLTDLIMRGEPHD